MNKYKIYLLLKKNVSNNSSYWKILDFLFCTFIDNYIFYDLKSKENLNSCFLNTFRVYLRIYRYYLLLILQLSWKYMQPETHKAIENL